jgi:hypothetical protein
MPMPDTAWRRLLALWSASSSSDADIPADLAFEGVEGGRALWLRAAGNGVPEGDGSAWIPFAFRQGHPDTTAHAPDAPYLLVVRAFASGGDREEFRRWLTEEHGPRQTTIRGVRWLQTYEEEGPEHSFLNLWGIEDPAIVDGQTWMRVRESPWWRRVAHIPAGADRGVYRLRVPVGD